MRFKLAPFVVALMASAVMASPAVALPGDPAIDGLKPVPPRRRRPGAWLLVVSVPPQ